MKVSLLLLVCATLFSVRSYSQTDTTERMKRNRYGSRGDTATFQESDSMYGMYGNQTRQTGDSMHHNGYVMQNGRMMVMRNGVTTMLNADTTLSNGTKIKRNGEIVVNGARRTLHEGEYVTMSGKIMPMNRGDRDMDKMNSTNDENRNMMRDSLNKNNRQGNKNIERERNRVKTPGDSVNRKSDMYLVPDSAKKNYERK